MVCGKWIGIVLCLVWPFLLACAGSTMSQKPGSNQATVENPTIHQIQEQPESYKGRIVNIAGTFKGWQGKCTGGSPVARSDWMLEDKTGCIYVSGPLPDGLSAISPQDEQLSVKGIIRVDRSGKTYIEVPGR